MIWSDIFDEVKLFLNCLVRMSVRITWFPCKFLLEYKKNGAVRKTGWFFRASVELKLKYSCWIFKLLYLFVCGSLHGLSCCESNENLYRASLRLLKVFLLHLCTWLHHPMPQRGLEGGNKAANRMWNFFLPIFSQRDFWLWRFDYWDFWKDTHLT